MFVLFIFDSNIFTIYVLFKVGNKLGSRIGDNRTKNTKNNIKSTITTCKNVYICIPYLPP